MNILGNLSDIFWDRFPNIIFEKICLCISIDLNSRRKIRFPSFFPSNLTKPHLWLVGFKDCFCYLFLTPKSFNLFQPLAQPPSASPQKKINECHLKRDHDSKGKYTWKTAVAVNFHQLETPKTSKTSGLKSGTFPRFSRIESVIVFQLFASIFQGLAIFLWKRPRVSRDLRELHRLASWNPKTWAKKHLVGCFTYYPPRGGDM